MPYHHPVCLKYKNKTSFLLYQNDLQDRMDIEPVGYGKQLIIIDTLSISCHFRHNLSFFHKRLNPIPRIIGIIRIISKDIMTALWNRHADTVFLHSITTHCRNPFYEQFPFMPEYDDIPCFQAGIYPASDDITAPFQS